ncbi:MAG: lactate utilization protein [Methanomicrobiales archaeon]|nr:lactate utilization protein [Methanomicrobiales archaeon]
MTPGRYPSSGCSAMVHPTRFSAVNLIAEAKVDPARWSVIPAEPVIAATAAAVGERGIRVIRTPDANGALDVLKAIIPPGSEVMNGSSTTLIEIGYEALLTTNPRWWKDYHALITAEGDENKRADLRRKSVTAEYFLSSANAIAQSGELLSCDRTGSRTGAWLFGAKNLIIVAGVNKIVPSLNDARLRIREYAYPLENARAHHAYGISSVIGKCAIIAEEVTPGRTTLVLVNEILGY